MVGIFKGLGNVFTGGGGSPDFEGLSDDQKNQLIKRQLQYGQTGQNLLSQWQNQSQSAYKANQNLLPLVYGELGITPSYDQNGNITGYQNTGNGPTGDTGQEAGTARMLGLNPYMNPDGSVDWNATAGSGDFLGHNWLADQRGNFNAQEDALANQGQDVYNRALGEFDRPEFNAEGLDAMRGNLTTQQALLDPSLYRMGITRDANGNLTTDWNSPEMANRSLQGDMLATAHSAMAGGQPIDPTVQRQLDQEETALKNQLAATLGPDYASSTPGMAALSDFAKRKAETIYSSNQDLVQRNLQGYQGLQGTNLNTLQMLQAAGQPVAQAAGQLNNASISQEQLRQAQRQSRFQNLSNTAQMLQGILGTQAQGNIGYQGAIDNTAFGTIGQMRDAQLANQNAQAQALANTSTRLNQFYGGIGGAYRDTGLSSAAALAAQLGNQNTALPWQQAKWQGDVTSDATNQNNMFWRNMASSAGSTIGKGASGGFI